MTRIESIENEVKRLTPEELAAFREWFEGFDAEVFDARIESDAAAGRLDGLAERTVEADRAG